VQSGGPLDLLPRERVEMLLDPDTPFLELAPSPRSTCTTVRRQAPASSPASAAWRVSSVECMVV
jgi:3-methylcrotonyl-CoA carboxylase beta subunit